MVGTPIQYTEIQHFNFAAIYKIDFYFKVSVLQCNYTFK